MDFMLQKLKEHFQIQLESSRATLEILAYQLHYITFVIDTKKHIYGVFIADIFVDEHNIQELYPEPVDIDSRDITPYDAGRKNTITSGDKTESYTLLRLPQSSMFYDISYDDESNTVRIMNKQSTN